MKLEDITKNILKDIVWRIYPTDVAKRDSLLNTIDSSIEDACDDLMEPHVYALLSMPQKHVLDTIYHCLGISHYFDAEATPVPTYFLYSVNDSEDESYLLPINTNSSPYILTCTSFWKNDSTLEDLRSNTNLLDAVFRIWQNIQPNTSDSELFWKQLTTRQQQSYYLAIDGQSTSIDKDKAWRHYAFGYLSVINDGKFPIPSKLEITNSIWHFKAPLQYNNYARYDQFFDTYNVLNEVKHSGDKLTKYLKTYHIVEQFAYRAKFIKLVHASQSQDRSLVRRLEALTDTFKQHEGETIVGSIESLFKDLSTILNSKIGTPDDVLSTDCRQFLLEKFNIKENSSHGYDIKSVGHMVYAFRNSIVHNKETEFHLTYNNVREYECIIPLLDILTTSLLDIIFKLIENNRGNKLIYNRKTLKLY